MVPGLHSKDRKSTRDKAYIGNPKVNKGCPHSQPIAPQQTVCKFHLDPQCNKFNWGSTTLEVPTLWNIMKQKLFIYTQHFTRLHALRRCLRNHVSVVLNSTRDKKINKINTHSYEGFAAHVNKYIISSNYAECSIGNWYVCGTKLLIDLISQFYFVISDKAFCIKNT